MTQFKEFTTVLDGDPVIICRDHVASAGIHVVRRGEKHEKVSTLLVLTSGGVASVREPFNEVREWLMPKEMFKFGDTVKVTNLTTDLNLAQSDPIGLVGEVIRRHEGMIHVRLQVPENEDLRSYPEMFFDSELELVPKEVR